MLLSIPSRLTTGQQLLTPADPGFPDSRDGSAGAEGRASSPSSPIPLPTPPRQLPSHHLRADAFAELGETSRTSHREPGQGSDPG